MDGRVNKLVTVFAYRTLKTGHYPLPHQDKHQILLAPHDAPSGR